MRSVSRMEFQKRGKVLATANAAGHHNEYAIDRKSKLNKHHIPCIQDRTVSLFTTKITASKSLNIRSTIRSSSKSVQGLKELKQ